MEVENAAGERDKNAPLRTYFGQSTEGAASTSVYVVALDISSLSALHCFTGKNDDDSASSAPDNLNPLSRRSGVGVHGTSRANPEIAAAPSPSTCDSILPTAFAVLLLLTDAPTLSSVTICRISSTTLVWQAARRWLLTSVGEQRRNLFHQRVQSHRHPPNHARAVCSQTSRPRSPAPALW